MKIVPFNKVPSRKQVGGKAHNLFLLKREGFQVPNFSVFSTSLLDKLLFDVVKIDKNIEDIFSEFSQEEGIEELKKIQKKIRDTDISEFIQPYLFSVLL